MGGVFCAVPPSASAEVAQVQDVALAAIFFHVIALLALGLLNTAQWIAAAIAILCSIGVLCRFRKGTYMAAVVGYVIAGFFDLVAVALWIILYDAVRGPLDDRANDFLELNSHSSLLSDSSSGSNDEEESYDIPEWTQIVGWPALDFILDRLGATSDVILCLAIPPMIAAVVMYEGYKSALAAVKMWKESGAPDAAQAV